MKHSIETIRSIFRKRLLTDLSCIGFPSPDTCRGDACVSMLAGEAECPSLLLILASRADVTRNLKFSVPDWLTVGSPLGILPPRDSVAHCGNAVAVL